MMTDWPTLREGQAASKSLSGICPTLGVEIMNTEWDPYLDDSKLDIFYVAIDKLAQEHLNLTANKIILDHPGKGRIKDENIPILNEAFRL